MLRQRGGRWHHSVLRVHCTLRVSRHLTSAGCESHRSVSHRHSPATARYCRTRSREAPHPQLGPSSAPSPSPKPPTSRRPLTPTTARRLSSSELTSAADKHHRPSRSKRPMPQPHHPRLPYHYLAHFYATRSWSSSRAAAAFSAPRRRHLNSACHCRTSQRPSASTTLAHSRNQHLTRRRQSRVEAVGRVREETGDWQRGPPQRATL